MSTPLTFELINEEEFSNVSVIFSTPLLADLAIDALINEINKELKLNEKDFYDELDKRYIIFDRRNNKLMFKNQLYDNVNAILYSKDPIFKNIPHEAIERSQRIISLVHYQYKLIAKLKHSKSNKKYVAYDDLY